MVLEHTHTPFLLHSEAQGDLLETLSKTADVKPSKPQSRRIITDNLEIHSQSFHTITQILNVGLPGDIIVLVVGERELSMSKGGNVTTS